MAKGGNPTFLNSARYYTGPQIMDALEYAATRAYSARVPAAVVILGNAIVAWIDPAPGYPGTVIREIDPFVTLAE